MERLLELGGDKNISPSTISIANCLTQSFLPDDIEDVLQKLEGSNIPVGDSDERLLEQAAAAATDDEDGADPDVELDLSAGTLEKQTIRFACIFAKWASFHC